MKRTTIIIALVSATLALLAAASATEPHWLGRWQAVELDGKPVKAARAPVLDLSADGTAGGWTGCNQFGATWSGTATAFRIMPGMMTRMACIGPDPGIEQTFLAVLTGAKRLERTAQTLTLWTDRGRSTFTLVAR
jgi:heat shock protein HslJ